MSQEITEETQSILNKLKAALNPTYLLEHADDEEINYYKTIHHINENHPRKVEGELEEDNGNNDGHDDDFKRPESSTASEATHSMHETEIVEKDSNFGLCDEIGDLYYICCSA